MHIGKFLFTTFFINILIAFVLGYILSTTKSGVEDNGSLELLAMFFIALFFTLLMLPSLFFFYISEQVKKVFRLL